MGIFPVLDSRILPNLRQRVWINGEVRPDAYCLSVSLGHGTGGSSALFELPSFDWDGPKRNLRGARVRVDVGYLDSPLETVFSGYLTSPSGSTSDRIIRVNAVSILGMADKIYIGQGDESGELSVEYPARVLYRGVLRDTGWNVASVIRDIFSSNTASWRGGGGRIPSGWRNMLRLGDTRVLARYFNDVPLGDQIFRQETLRGALDALLSVVGTVSFRERFRGNVTFLDFFEFADGASPIKPIVIAKPGQAINGSNVLDARNEDVVEDVVTRIIALGDQKRYTVSVTTEHETAPLIRAWEEELEAEVLADPEAIQREILRPGVDEEWKNRFSRVFRRYELPECFRHLQKDKELAVELEDGTRLKIQAWMFGRTLIREDEEPVWTSELNEAPTIIKGVEWHLEDNYFILQRPAINFVSGELAGNGAFIDTYEEAVVGVTLTVAGSRLKYDTGIRSNGISLLGISGDGLTEVFTNETFQFRQFSNIDEPFLERIDGGESHVFPETWVFDGAWNFYDGKIVSIDDSQILRRFAQSALREKNNPRILYSVTTPFFTSSYRIGDRIRMFGQNNADLGTHQIQSIQHDLSSDHVTVISTDSSVPMIASSVLGGG